MKRILAGWRDHLLDPRSTIQSFSKDKAKPRPDLARQLRAGRTRTTLHSGRGFLFSHRLENLSGRRMEFLFASEVTLNLKDAHVNCLGEASGVRRFAVLDPAARLEAGFFFGRPARLWYFPLETGSGARRRYRGVKLAGVWPVKLPPGKSWRLDWKLEIKEPDGWPRGKS